MTLIEVLITLSILSTALLALASFQRYTFTSNALAGQRAKAVSFAHERFDYLRMTSLSSYPPTINISGKDTLGPPSSGGSIEIEGLTTLFNRSWTILLLKNGKLAQVNVAVLWRDHDGSPHNISLDSIISLASPLESVTINF